MCFGASRGRRDGKKKQLKITFTPEKWWPCKTHFIGWNVLSVLLAITRSTPLQNRTYRATALPHFLQQIAQVLNDTERSIMGEITLHTFHFLGPRSALSQEPRMSEKDKCLHLSIFMYNLPLLSKWLFSFSNQEYSWSFHFIFVNNKRRGGGVNKRFYEHNPPLIW